MMFALAYPGHLREAYPVQPSGFPACLQANTISRYMWMSGESEIRQVDALLSPRARTANCCKDGLRDV